jgi:protein-tyrosine sulfotransferase
MIKSFLRRVIKGRHSFLEPERYVFPLDGLDTGDEVLNTVRAMHRGRQPSIILHGVMPRSGTVFVSELLGRHPDLFAYPREIKEFPFLRLTGNVQALYDEYANSYPVDRKQISGNDFLALFGESVMAHLYTAVPDGCRVLLKIPNVEYLPYFFTVFPLDNLIVLMRDGRDVVNSALKTWPNYSIVDVCKWWNNSARLMLQCHKRFSGMPNYYFARYEDVVRDPAEFVRGICRQFELDDTRYPFDKIDSLPLFGSSVDHLGRNVSWKPMKKPENFNPVGRWSNWPVNWKRTFKKIAGQTLLDLGYCADLDW